MLLLLAIACRGPGTPDSPADSDSLADSSRESSPDSPPDSPPDSEAPGIELELVSQDFSSFEGLVLQEWRAADFVGWDDQPASFLLLRPEGEAELGLALLLHGSVAMDDGLQPSKCKREDMELARSRMVEEWQVLPWQGAQRELAVLAPLNPWCDLWLGQGEQDPVDTSHRGYEFIELGLDWLEGDQHGLDINGARVVWGTSTGSIGAAQVLARREDFQGAAFDSGPVDFSDSMQEAYLEAVEHVVGSDQERRDSLDPVALAASGQLSGRVLQLGNNQDTVTSPTHLRAMEAALASGHEGGWQSWDLDHPSPSTTFHVQGGLRLMPYPYLSEAALDWLLEGGEVAWLEAEDCGSCSVGTPSSTAGWAENAWSGAVQVAEAGEAPGVMARFELPEHVPDDHPVQATVLMGLPGEGEVSDLELIELRWLVDGSPVATRTVNAQELATGELDEIDLHLQASRLGLPAREPGQRAVLEVGFQGGAVVLVDAALLRW